MPGLARCCCCLFYGETAVGGGPCFLARRQASPRSEPPCSMPPRAGIGGCAEGSHAGEATLTHSQELPAPVLHKTISCLRGQSGAAHNKQLQMAVSCHAGRAERPARASGWAVRAAGSKADRNLAPPFLRRKDKGSRPQNNLSSTLHTLIHHTIEEEYICARL